MTTTPPVSSKPAGVRNCAAREVTLRNGTAVVIRSAVPDDAEALLELTRAVIDEGEFVVTTPQEFHLTVEDEREWIGTHSEHPGRLAIVLEAAGQVVGCLHFQNSHRHRLAHRGRLHMIIDKDWRNLGVGTLLLQEALAWARRNPGIEKVGLAVFSNNHRAIHLYEKCGFQVEGRRVREIQLDDGRYVDEVLMYCLVGSDDQPEAGAAG